MKRKRQSIGQYTALPWAIKKQPAWRAMSPEARLLWIELRGWLRNDGLNNGKIYLSCRDAAKTIGLSKNTVARRYAENEHYGFLRKISGGYLGSDGRGIAASYRFTDLAHGTHSPSRDYEKWEGEKFVYTPRRTGRKKQKPVPPRGTPCPTAWDIRTVPEGGSVCTTAWDIGGPPKCTTAWDISRLPLVKPPIEDGGRTQQGGVTASTPAQAGGAGSSPAPVAKPDLTAMVLDVVAAQLDELDRRREAARAPRKPDLVPKPATIPTAGAHIPSPAIYGQARPRIYGRRSAE
jgi:hypothetical protein